MAVNNWKYNERDEELVKVVLCERGKWDEYNVRDDVSIYDGEPWLLFDKNANTTHYVLEKLKRRTEETYRFSKRFNRNAGCGAWRDNSGNRKVYDRDGQCIGYKKQLFYKHPINSIGKYYDEDKGWWVMHEYMDLKNLEEGDYVLCVVKYCKSV